MIELKFLLFPLGIVNAIVRRSVRRSWIITQLDNVTSVKVNRNHQISS